MKRGSELRGPDLLNLPLGEFDWLEAKGRRVIDISDPRVKLDQAKQTMSKAVSAFANTGGGRLVIGMNVSSDSWQVDGGGVPRKLKSGTREWLEDIVPHLVDPMLQTFNVYEVHDFPPGSGLDEDCAVYVLDVGDSLQAPHMASDHVYYGRVAGKSRPLGNRLVRDILGRRRDPVFEVSVEAERRVHSVEPNALDHFHYLRTQPGPREVETRELVVSARNVGRAYAKYVSIEVKFPLRWLDDDRADVYASTVEVIDGERYVSEERQNTRRDVVDVKVDLSTGARRVYGPARYEPILPGLRHTWSMDLAGDRRFLDLCLPIFWTLHADNSGRSEGVIQWSEIVRRGD